MKKTLILLAAMLCLLSAGVGALLFGWLRTETGEGSVEVAAETQALLDSTRETLKQAEARAEAAQRRVTELEEALAAVETRLQSQTAATKTDAAEGGKETAAALAGKGKASMANYLEAMQKDPAMKEFLSKQQELLVDQTFGTLFGHLELSEEDLARFRELLVSKQNVAMDKGMELMNADLAQEDRSALSQQLRADQKKITGEIKALLGEDAFEQYKMFERSQPERQHINAFKQSLTSEGQDLSYDSEVELMTAMYEARENFKFTLDFSEQGSENNPDVLKNLNESNIDKFIEENRLLQENVLESVTGILSSEQLKVFRETQEAQATMQEFGMRMGAKMFSDGQAKE